MIVSNRFWTFGFLVVFVLTAILPLSGFARPGKETEALVFFSSNLLGELDACG